MADEPAAGQTAEVKVTVVFPAALDSFDGRSVKVLLNETDPPQPGDKPGFIRGHAVETQQIDKLSHVKGTESKQLVVVGSKTKLNPKAKYLVIAQILADGKSKGIARVDGKPSAPVLTDGAPREVTMTVVHLVK